MSRSTEDTKVLCPTTLRVQLVGPFGVSADGRRLAPTKVGSRKARTVLALLAVRSGQLVDASDIRRVLWPDRPPRQATANIATLVSRLRLALGRGVILGERGTYQIGRAVEVDLDAAAGLIDVAEKVLAENPAVARSTAQRAADLLGAGAVLVDFPEAAWAGPTQALLESLTRRARLILAEAALHLGHASAAEQAASLAIEVDPLDEPGYRALMCAYAAAGEPARALTAYHRLRAVLADEIGIDPASSTQDIYLAILRNEVPDLRRIRMVA